MNALEGSRDGEMDVSKGPTEDGMRRFHLQLTGVPEHTTRERGHI